MFINRPHVKAEIQMVLTRSRVVSLIGPRQSGKTTMVKQFQPWYANLKKRQVKSPKIYFRDSGLLHYLLNIRTEKELLTHPRLGTSWEGYVVEEILKTTRPDEAYFWGTHQGAELDMLLFIDEQRIGIEIKRADAPRLTRSMKIALSDLELDQLFVVYPGIKPYPLAKKVSVLPLTSLVNGLPDLG